MRKQAVLIALLAAALVPGGCAKKNTESQEQAAATKNEAAADISGQTGADTSDQTGQDTQSTGADSQTGTDTQNTEAGSQAGTDNTVAASVATVSAEDAA